MNLPVAFGKYLLTERVAAGGMAEIFKAKAFGFGGFEKIVAIKKIHSHLSLDQEFVNMFIDEARIASHLSHPNIVQIFDLGKIDNSYFIAMEYVEGITLEKFIQMELPHNEKIFLSTYIVKEIARALDYAHTKKASDGTPLNIVHRDISPQNILISDDGVVKLTDFGVAKARFRLSRTEAGTTKGKYPYMSPEQVMGGQVDNRSDIFSLSVVFYELLTGKLAFDGETEYEIMESIKKCEIVPPRKINRDIPEKIEEIIIKGLQKHPLQRFTSAGELALLLNEFLVGNRFTEPQENLKRVIKQIKNVNKQVPDEKVAGSTIALKPEMKRTQKFTVHAITGILAILLVVLFLFKSSHPAKRTENVLEVMSSEKSVTENNPIPIGDPSQVADKKENTEQTTLQSRININTNPWCYVYVDGKKIGETPIFGIKLPPGQHTFIFENPQFNLKVQKIITTAPGEEKTILENLTKK